MTRPRDIGERRLNMDALRKLGAAVGIAIALLMLVRAVVLGESLSGPELLAGAAALLGAGLLLRWRSGKARTIGALSLGVGIVLLVISLAVLVYAVLWCCP